MSGTNGPGVAAEIFQYPHLAGRHADDLRRDPLALCKAPLASIVVGASASIRFNKRIEGCRKISGIGQKLCSNLKASSQLISRSLLIR
jgi:hypothetical protein